MQSLETSSSFKTQEALRESKALLRKEQRAVPVISTLRLLKWERVGIWAAAPPQAPSSSFCVPVNLMITDQTQVPAVGVQDLCSSSSVFLGENLI